ncbi:MAG: MBL fold metallo-hydrolase [Candidatus Riflebacteria bacterium]|nr:MBL fold metallo-hydrolase [Candidatus Riflebacteria bacterium]
MIFEQLNLGNMQNFSYLFADSLTHEGFIIDPAFDHVVIMEAVKRLKINLTRIILTHHHFDHINAANPIKSQTGAEIICHRETAPLLHGGASYDRLIDDNYSFTTGNSKIVCLHTPGHAPGSLCLIVSDKWLITGDTLFINDCGRADLAGSSPKALFESLQRLKALPDHLIVCPGHNYGPAPTRILGKEKQLNPTLLAKNIEEFCKLP